MARSLGALWCAVNDMNYPPKLGNNCSLNNCAGNPSTTISLGTDFDFSDFIFDNSFYFFDSGLNSTGIRVNGSGNYWRKIIRKNNFYGSSSNNGMIVYEGNDASEKDNFNVTWNNLDIGFGIYDIYFDTTDGNNYSPLYYFLGSIQATASVNT
jgi:hypothetical protein